MQHNEYNNNNNNNDNEDNDDDDAAMRQRVERGLEFAVFHFEMDADIPLVFPRRVSSYATNNQQYDAYSKEHALEFFEASKWFDCRISAYLNYNILAAKGVFPWGYVPQKVLLFIDQEQGDIKTTLHNIKIMLNGGNPSVVFTGHGYHIYMPLLLTNKEFHNNEQLTFDFLRFIEKRVSNNKSDNGHFQSLRSSMMRIPFTFNSKCVEEEDDDNSNNNDFVVRIVQKWDGHRVTPDAKLFNEFLALKNRQQIKELKDDITQIKIVNKIKANNNAGSVAFKDPLKEFLIFESQGISDGRKNMLYYVISRYLIRERYFSPDETRAICSEWLARCNNVRKLHDRKHYLNYHVNHCIDDAVNRNRNSMPVELLKHYSIDAYNQLMTEYEEFKNKNNNNNNVSPQSIEEVKSGA